MKQTKTWYTLILLACVSGCVNKSAHPVLYDTDFTDPSMQNWIVETVDGSVRINQGDLDIDVSQGCTVWFKQQITAPVRIEFDVTVVDANDPNDRVSDLNCFWMAIDPNHPNDIFANHENRTGAFDNYHAFRLYYVGMGGNSNTSTRFRRYPGTGQRPLLPEHDLSDASVLLQANQRISIAIESTDQGIKYWRDSTCLFDVTDNEPFQSGWFGFRTVHNHMQIHNFKVTQL